MFAEFLQNNMKPNKDMTKGWHSCSCKAGSASHTFSVSLAGKKVKTNSLLLHYVKNHRSEVPEDELNKLKIGMEYEMNKQQTKKMKM